MPNAHAAAETQPRVHLPARREQVTFGRAPPSYEQKDASVLYERQRKGQQNDGKLGEAEGLKQLALPPVQVAAVTGHRCQR